MPRRYRDYHAEYLARMERGRKAKVSKRAARGHARRDEITMKLRQDALKAAERKLTKRPAPKGGRPNFDRDRMASRIADADAETLRTMISISADEWANLARSQIAGNPFWYSNFTRDV